MFNNKIIIPSEKREEILNELRQLLLKRNTVYIKLLLNDSSVSKFVTKEWIEVNNLSRGQYSVNKKLKFKTSTLKSVLIDYRDAFIIAKRTTDLSAIADN